MPMSNITDTMSADHRRCDELFANAESLVAKGDWAESEVQFNTFHQATERHFSMEEEVLFPAFEQATGMTMGPTQVMRSEHVQMRQLFSEMQDALSRQDGDRYLGLSDTLMVLMQQHNMKEEQMLYRMADQALADSVSEVLDRMQQL